MSIHTKLFALRNTLFASAAALSIFVGGCRSTSPAPDDATLTSQVQGRLSSDPTLSGQSVKAYVSGGVATLSGNVNSDSARTAAGGDAAQIAGVRTVVNNLTVQTAAAPPSAAPPPPTEFTPPPAPVRTEPHGRPSAAIARNTPARPEQRAERQQEQAVPQSAPVVRNSPPQQAQVQTPPTPSTPPAPPQPVVRNLTVPSGTVLPVRITQTLDSATTQQGDKFTGAIASDIVIDGVVALAQGTPVTGHVDAVQDATHFTGSSLLTISLTSINRRGDRLDIVSEPFTKQGQGRGKNTAEKVGGGAALGAILGGIIGGGKGAAIGTAAGAGVGAGAQGVTRGQQVQIPSESVIRFRLTNEIPVRVTINPNDNGSSNVNNGNDGNMDTHPVLERRPRNPQ